MRKKKKWERLLATILTVAMIFGSLPTSALAGGDGLTFGLVSENEETGDQTETEAVTEKGTGAEVEVVTEAETGAEPETEAKSGAEPATEAESGLEPATEAESGIELVTEAETEAGTEEFSEAESETETILEDQGISEAAVFEVPTDDGKVVKLSAPEGAFTVPASEVTMTVDPLTEEQKAAIEEQLQALAAEDGMKMVGYVAYDINLWVNGKIVRPLLPVQVTFENIAVTETVEDEEDVPKDMSQVETAGFQMDTATNEITDVNDTTVADDATPINATVAVEVGHFTPTGTYMFQVDESSPKNYNFTMEQTGGVSEEGAADGEDGGESEEMLTFEVNVESLKGIGAEKLTLVPSVVDGTEEAEEGGTQEGEAEGTPVNVTFQSGGEEVSEMTNPTALGVKESWTQKIQIPVSELESVANPMLNLSLRSGGKEIATINSGTMLMGLQNPNKPTMSQSNNSSSGKPEFEHHKTIDYLGDKGSDSGIYTQETGEDLYRLYLDITGAAQPMDLLIVVDESGSMRAYKDIDNEARYKAVEKLLNGNPDPNEKDPSKKAGLIETFMTANEENELAIIEFRGSTLNKESGYTYAKDAKVITDKNGRNEWNWTTGKTWKNNKKKFPTDLYTPNRPTGFLTNCDAGLYKAAEMFASKNDGRKHVMVFISDGAPTLYINNSGQQGTGYETAENYRTCIDNTLITADVFHDAAPDVTVYSVGMRMGSGLGSEGLSAAELQSVLRRLASVTGGSYIAADDTNTLINKVWEIMFPYGVQIEDNLSKYVDFATFTNGKDISDVCVTMQKGTENPIFLYQNDAVTSNGSDKLDATNPVVKNGKTIRVSFKNNYPLDKDYVYTLSFNVKLTQIAKDEFKEKGYGGTTGEKDTDWGSNTTSSEKGGFYSNSSATVSWKNSTSADAKRESDTYEMPVVQTHTQVKTSPTDNYPKNIDDTIEYTVKWQNTNTSAATVVITDKLDKNVEFVTGTLDGKGVGTGSYDSSNHTITWTITDAAPGATGSITFKVKIKPEARTEDTTPDKVTNQATVKVGNESTVTDVVENPIPKKTEDEPGNKQGVAIGATIKYRVHWENCYDETKSIIVKDKLDQGLTYVANSAKVYNSSNAVMNGANISYNENTHTLTWTFDAEKNTHGTVYFEATVNEKALQNTDQKVVNDATVKVGDSPEVKTNEVENPVTKPEKTELSPGNKKGVTVGDIIEYQVSWENYKNTEADVIIKDTLESGLDYVSAGNGGVYDKASRTITWTLKNQAAKAKGVVTFKAMVNASADDYKGAADWQLGDGKVLNKASVQVGTDPEVETNVVENPVSTPHKTEPDPGNGKTVKIGQTITYNVSWENYTDKPADVIITDRLDPGVDVDKTSISDNGVYNEGTRTITWTLKNKPARGTSGSKGTVSFKVTINKEAYDPGATGSKDGISTPGDLEVLNQANVKVGNEKAVDTEIMKNPVTNPEKTPAKVTTPDGTTTDLGNHGLVQIGDIIHYEITWANYKDVEAEVVVTDELETGLTYVAGSAKAYDSTENEISASITAPDGTSSGGIITWNLGEKPAKSFGKVSFDAKVNESAGTQVENNATVTVDHEPTVTNKVDNPRPEKKEENPGEHKGMKVGDTITYTITWRNSYDEAADVVITDTLDEGLTFESAVPDVTSETTDASGKTVLTWNLGEQNPGKGTVTLNVKVNNKALMDHVVDNEAFVRVGSNPAVRTDKVENPVPEKKEVTPGADKLVNVGDVITYEIDWYNTHDDARTVTITDKLDPNVECVEESISDGGNHVGDTITWEFTADANSTGKVTFQVKVLESARKYGEKDAEGNNVYGKVVNSAGVTVENDNTVHVGPVENPVPKKEETDPGDGKSVAVGQEITYKIFWENSYDESRTVTITDVLDEGLDFVSASDGGVVVETQEGEKTVRTVTWNLPEQDPNSTGFVTFVAKVNEKALDNDNKVENQADVQIGTDPKVTTNKVENPVPEKSETTPGADQLVNVGDTITYAIDWQNGHDDERTVTITDKLDPNVEYVVGSASDGGDYDEGTRTITWNLGKQAGKASGTVTFSVKVLESARKYGEPDQYGKVKNSATVQVENDKEVTVGPVENPVPKKEESTPGVGRGVKPGDTITYDIYWENSNDSEAEVTITDDLDVGVRFVETAGEHKDDAAYDQPKHRLTWTFKAEAGAKGKVSFTVEVRESAVDYGNGGDGKVVNDATVKVGNSSATTNKVENPTTEPHKTEVTPGDRQGVKVGDTIEYKVDYENYKDAEATVTITDKLDLGLNFVSVENGGVYDVEARVITWTLENVPARGETGSKGFVTFKATVNKAALDYGQTGAADGIFVPGDGKVLNQAEVQVGEDPAIKTEVVENPVTEPDKNATAVESGSGNHADGQPAAGVDGTYNDTVVQVGDTITYTIDWENYEETTATVTITDELDDGLTYVENSATNGGVCTYNTTTKKYAITWTLENVPARGRNGSKGTVSFKATVNENARTASKVVNDASVQVGDHPALSTKPVENPVPEKTETDPGPNLGVYPGDEITYEISWANTHDEPADVVITDVLDPGVEYIEAIGEHAADARLTVASSLNSGTGATDQNRQTVTWTFTAGANDSGKVSFKVVVLESAVGYEPGSEDPNKDGKVVNQAQVQVGNSSAYTSKVENPTTNPHKTETKPGDKQGVKVGDQIDYMVTYENYKNAEATVKITDRLDPGLTYKEGSASDGGVYNEDSRTITWTLEKVPARGTEDCTGFVTFSATVNEKALDYGEIGEADGIFVPGDGKVLNQASVQVDTDPAVDTEIVENPVTEPDKNATAITPAEGSGDDIVPEPNADGTFNDTVAQVGDVITYTINWENYEETEATVIITDQLKDGLTYVEGSAGDNSEYDAETHTITWTLTNVPARGQEGSTGTVTFQATVNENALPNGKVVNDASVEVGNHGVVKTKPVENPVPEKTEVTPGADLGVRPGDEITYEITWENTYDTETTVTITDVLDPGVRFVEAIGGHAADAQLTTSASLDGPTGATDQNRQTVTWTFQAEANKKGTVSFKVVVLESAVDYEDGGDGKVVNRAKVQVGDNSRYTNEVENPTTEPHKTEVTPGNKAGVQAGSTIEYKVDYENYKNAEATVTITDRLDPGLDYVDGSASDGGVYDADTRTITWTLEKVPARGETGSTGSVTFKATVNKDALDTGATDKADGIFVPGDEKVLNQAEVQVGNDPKIKTEIVENPVTEPEKEVTEITPANKDVTLEPGKDGTYNDTVVQVGDVITYTIKWENYETDEDGNPVNADVTITDVLEAGLTYVKDSVSDGGDYDEETRTITWTLKNVAPGPGTVTFQATVNENAWETDKVENQASVQVGSYLALSTKPVENPVPEKTEVTPGADLGVYPGEEITYDITWENTYDEEVTVTITDALDPGVDFLEAIGGHAADAQLSYGASFDRTTGQTMNRQIVTWTFRADANTKGTVSFRVKVLDSAVDYEDGGDGKVVNRAKVQVGNSSTYTNEIENPTTEPHKSEVTPGDKAGVRVGDTIEYRVDYENYKNKEATVTITDTLDPGLTYVSASDNGVYDEATRTITWTLENIPARGETGSTGHVTFQAKVNELALDYGETGDADGIFVPGDGKVVNQASVQVDTDPAINTEIVENPVTEPEKEATAVESGAGNHVDGQPTANDNGTPEDPTDDNYNDVVAQVGDTITYTINWENYESTMATVTITDKLKDGLTYVPNSATSGGVYDEATRTITWTLPNIPARGLEGSTGTVSFRATVNENARPAVEVVNDASVQVGDHPALSTKPVENPVPEKTEVTPGEHLGVYPGDEITYEISWMNTHDEPAEVVITDKLDPGVEYIEAIGDHAADAKLTVAASMNSSTGTADQNRQTVTWTFTADPNTRGKVSFRVRVLESAVGYEPGSAEPNKDGKVVNQALVQVGNSSAYTSKVENPTTNPHKTETAPGDKQGVRVGDQIDYMVTYENYKNAEATVTITDRLDPGLDYVEGSASDGGVYDAATRTITWTMEKVPARGTEGCTGFVTFSATVNEKALDYGQTGDTDGIFVPGDGKVLNQAAVRVDNDPEIQTEIVENPVTEPKKDATAVTPADGSGDVQVEQNAGTYNDAVVQVGDTITYTIRWENYEATEATVTVTDTLEEGLTYVEGSAKYGYDPDSETTDGVSYDPDTKTITWTIPNVPARGQAGSTGYAIFQATVNAAAEAAGKVINDASVQVGNHGALKTEPVENPIPEKTEVTPGENLGVKPGDEITYEITWENTYDVESTVTITDELDPGVRFVEAIGGHAADAQLTTSASLDGPTGATDQNRQTVTWTFQAKANTKGTVSFKVVVLESAVDYADGGDGKVVNRAKVQVGDNSRYTNEVENPTTEPHKTEVTPGNKAGVQVGNTIEYKVTYENYKDTAADVTITDRLDPGLDFVSASDGGVYDGTTRTITWTIPNVPPRSEDKANGIEERFVIFQATVNENALDTGATGDADGIFVPGDKKVLNQAEVQVDHDPAIKTEIVENPVTEPKKNATAVEPADKNVTVVPNKDGQTYDDQVVQVGDVITYTIEWENYETDDEGNPVNADVTVKDVLDVGLTYVEGSATSSTGETGSYDENSRTITWTLKNVAPGPGTVTFQAAVNENAREADKVENQAGVQVGSYPELLTKPVENPVPEKEERTPGEDIGVYPGTEITYYVSWENAYDEDALVTITDTLDPGVEFVRVFDSEEEGFEAGHAADAEYDARTRTVIWKFTAEADTKGKVAFTVKVLESAVDYGMEDGDGKVVNRARVQVGNSSTYTNEVENPTTEPHKTEVTPGDTHGVRVGDTIEYRVDYENYRDEEATVTITDTLDPGLDYVAGSASSGGKYDAATRTITWTLEKVPARGSEGSTGYVTFKATVNADALDYGSKETDSNPNDIFVTGDGKVVNQASVKVGNDPAIKTEIVENPVTEPEKEAAAVTPAAGNHAVQLQAGADGTFNDTVVQVGDTITYTIRWENYEETTAAVTITDKLEDRLTYVPNSATSAGKYDEATRTITWTLPNIPARGLEGSTGTVSFQATVNENARETDKVDNDASVQVGTHPALETNPVENPVPEKTETDPGENLGVYPGDEITYEISWANTYDEAAEVVVTDVLDPGVSYVEGSAGENSAYDAAAHTLTWTFTAQANTSGTVSFKVTVLESAVNYDPNGTGPENDGKVVNQAQVQVGNSSAYTNKVENPTTNPHKSEVKPGDREGVKVGDQIDYMVTYENYKNESATVIITDKLDPGLDYVAGSASSGGKYDAETRTITWTIPNVPARRTEGSTGFVTFSAVVNEKALDYGQTGTEDGIFVPGDGKVVNQAAVKVGNDAAVNTEIVENPVTEPKKDATEVTPAAGSGDITVEANADGTFNDVTVQVGDTITYTIRWENYEDSVAAVTVTDTLDPGLTYVAGSASSGGVYDEAARTITWTMTNVPARGQAGSTGSVTFRAVVNENAKAADKVTNGAGVQVGSHGTLSTKPVENPVPEKEERTPGADLGVYPGEEITYDITWENTYDAESKVTVTDVLDPGVEFVKAVDDHAADASYDAAAHTVTWTFTAQAGTSGKVSFTVRVLESAVDYGTEGGDGKVVNRAKVQVGSNSRYTNEVENPTTEPHKTENTPGDKVGVQVGSTIEYKVTYENYKDTAATVIITDKLDPGLDYVEGSASSGGVYDAAARTITWTLENVPARGSEGSTGEVTFQAKVNQRALDDTEDVPGDGDIFGPNDQKVLNQAAVKVGSDPEIRTEIVENPTPNPEKTEVTPGEGRYVFVGDEITYAITWRNYRDEAADVVITDPLDKGVDFVSADNNGIYDKAAHTVTWTLKNQAAGAEGKVELKVKVNAAATQAGIVNNQAHVKVGNNPAVDTRIIPNPTPNPEKTEVTPGEGRYVFVGDEITYAITWRNYRTETANVVITDPLDKNVEFVSADHNGIYDKAAHTVTWTFENQAAGAEGTVELKVKVKEGAAQAGEVNNQAHVKVGNDPVVDTRIIPNPTPNPEKTETTPGEGEYVFEGDEITYKITWRNYRTETADVIITDPLDKNVEFVSADNSGVYDKAAHTVTWTLTQQAAGAKGTVELKVKVKEGAAQAGEVNNQAHVKVGNDPTVDTRIIPNPTPNPEKTEMMPGEDKMVLPGDEITYEITWRNYRAETADVIITDPLDKNVEFVSADHNGVYDEAAHTVTWTLAQQPAGAEGRVTLAVRVLESAASAGEVNNQAHVKVGNNPAVDTRIIPNPVPNPHKTEVTPGSGLSVKVGDTITYSVTYDNYRKEAAAVTITDRLDPGLDYVDGSADNGGVYNAETRTLTWTLENVPAGGRGFVTFRATVNENAVDTGAQGGADGIFVPGDLKVLNQASVKVGDDPAVDTEIMENPLTDENAAIQVTKTIMYNGEPLNAVDETFYVALFSDEERTERVSEVKAIEFKNASSSTVEFTGIELGRTYYIGETDANGVLIETGQLADGTIYRADFNEGYEVTVSEADGTVTRHFNNYLEEIPTSEYYFDGTLTVTKQLLDVDGMPVAGGDQTFYAGVFADADHTVLSDRVEKNIIPLTPDETGSASETAAVSIVPGETLTLYVTEVDETGKPVSEDPAFLYTLILDKENVTITEEKPDGYVTMTNRPNMEEHFYKAGELTITKQLLGADGTAKASNETFYAGIFADAAHTELAGNVSANIVGLSLEGNTSASETVEVSFGANETVTLYVTEVDEDGMPVENAASFAYNVTVDGSSVTMNNEETEASVVITNKEKPEEGPEPVPGENPGDSISSTPEGGSSTAISQNSVKTGDETPIMLYLGIFLAAAAALVILFFGRRKRVRK